jgi:hypothetical protein
MFMSSAPATPRSPSSTIRRTPSPCTAPSTWDPGGCGAPNSLATRPRPSTSPGRISRAPVSPGSADQVQVGHGRGRAGLRVDTFSGRSDSDKTVDMMWGGGPSSEQPSSKAQGLRSPYLWIVLLLLPAALYGGLMVWARSDATGFSLLFCEHPAGDSNYGDPAVGITGIECRWRVSAEGEGVGGPDAHEARTITRQTFPGLRWVVVTSTLVALLLGLKARRARGRQ